MAILQTKYVDVGVYTIYGTTITGFISTGSISNTQNGSSDVNLDSVFSGADIVSFYHSTTSGQGLAFSLSGNRANGTFDTLKIGGVSFARTAATHSYNSGNNRTTWTWSSVSSSPFGSTVGADKIVTWETTSTGSAPVISGVSNNNAAAPTVTASISLSSNGSGGTLQYAQTTSNSAPSSGWSSAAAFSHPRGATRYYWARQSSSLVSSSVSHSVGYLTGDGDFSRTSPTIAHNASSATTTIQYATAGETLAIRVDGQSTNLVTAAVASSSSSQNITFSSSLPSAGSSETYRFFVRRPTSTGGDGSTFTSTDMTFTVQMSAQDTTPNAFTLQNVTNAGLSTVYQSVAKQVTGITGTVNVSVSGAGSPQVQIGTGAWTSGPTTITNNFYINARLTSSASNSTAHTATVTVGTYSEDFTVTTVAASGSSGGSTSGGTGTFGVEIYDTDGSTTVLSPSTRYINFMQGPQTILVPGSGTVLLQQDMTGLTTSNSELAFTEFGDFTMTVTRITTGAVSSQGFQVTNNTTTAFTIKPYILRF